MRCEHRIRPENKRFKYAGLYTAPYQLPERMRSGIVVRDQGVGGGGGCLRLDLCFVEFFP